MTKLNQNMQKTGSDQNEKPFKQKNDTENECNRKLAHWRIDKKLLSL